jgi:hypothetical protein
MGVQRCNPHLGLPDPMPCGSGEASQLKEFHFHLLVENYYGVAKISHQFP